ncbi:MAG TPA: bifunctional precorrin-2 dehydrogenase/sirohydrochlorin ferrochelatase [Syntrophomonadaceae bacterium]|nr:bifunctional precorrin-2 dehydrogenase/sirohydrochlorin ferrochelatase [Syntrophomonadaceae bacterium]
MNSSKHLYPIYIDLSGKSCLVVGGGSVAERKVENLLEYGANVFLVSPEVTDTIRGYAQKASIRWEKRKFQPNDLKDVFLVYIATNDNKLNQSIAQSCQAKRILVNAVDDPPNCDFYVPALVRRGSLGIAISTEGKSPMLARRLRQDLEACFPEVYSEYLDLLGESREYIKENFADINIRRQIYEDLIESDILDLLKGKDGQKARERVWECISLWQD